MTEVEIPSLGTYDEDRTKWVPTGEYYPFSKEDSQRIIDFQNLLASRAVMIQGFAESNLVSTAGDLTEEGCVALYHYVSNVRKTGLDPKVKMVDTVGMTEKEINLEFLFYIELPPMLAKDVVLKNYLDPLKPNYLVRNGVRIPGSKHFFERTTLEAYLIEHNGISPFGRPLKIENTYEVPLVQAKIDRRVRSSAGSIGWSF